MNRKKLVIRCLLKIKDSFQIVSTEIEYVDGRVSELRYTDSDNSCDDAVIIPAFFNIHSHLGECIFRNIEGSDWTISKYLKYTQKYDSGLIKEQRNDMWMESAKMAAEEMGNLGTVGFCAARSAEIAVDYDMLTMSGYPIMNSKKLADYKAAGINGFRTYWNKNKSDNNMIGVFLHSVYANDANSFNLAKECIDMGAEFITVHVSEDEETSRLERNAHGMSAIALLDTYGLLSEKTILVHGGFCAEEDLKIVKNRGVVISVCPISNRFLNTKMVDLELLDALGIPWCIASDGLGTGRTFSLIDQVKAAKREFPNISYERFWKSITSVPGRSFKNDLYTGNIETGVKSTFLKTEYCGNDASELLKELLEGKIGYKPIKV